MAEILQQYFTAAEIAERLKWSERKLRRIVREREIPVLEEGRDIRFDARALTALEEALRKSCQSGSTAAKGARTCKSTSQSGKNAYERALKRLSSLSPAKRRQSRKPNSSEAPGTANVVALDPSLKRS